MRKEDFIKAFNEGRELRNGKITLKKGDYFSLKAEFLLKTNDIEDTDCHDIVIVGDAHYPGGMNLHICTNNWKVTE